MITLEQSIESLRRAQELVDRGVIGRTEDTFASTRADGKACFCAVGAIAADRLQPTITKIKYWPLPKEERVTSISFSAAYGDDHIAYATEIIEMNDEEHLTFGEIADKLQEALDKED